MVESGLANIYDVVSMRILMTKIECLLCGEEMKIFLFGGGSAAVCFVWVIYNSSRLPGWSAG